MEKSEQHPLANPFSLPDCDMHLRLKYKKKRATFQKANAQIIHTFRKASQAEFAKATTNAINRKMFCSGQKVSRSDSHIPHEFDRVGIRFIKKAKIILERS